MIKKYLTCLIPLTLLVVTAVSAPLRQAQTMKPAAAAASKSTRSRARARSAKAPAARRTPAAAARRITVTNTAATSTTATGTAATASDSEPQNGIESGINADDSYNTMVDCGEANLSGLGEFAVEGDQFVIRQGATVKTGIFSTHQTGNYTAVALHLIDPTLSEAKTISFRLMKDPSGVYSLEAIPGLGGNCRIQNIGIRWPPRRPR